MANQAMTNVRERARRQIICAAEEEFAAHGFDASTLESIAARAELPKSNVLYYFKSKRKLYDSVLEVVTQPLLEASRLLDAKELPEQALKAFIEAKFKIAIRHPNASSVFVKEMLHGGQRLPDASADALQQALRMNLDCLKSWMDRQLIKTMAPEQLLLFIWSTTQAYINFGWQASMLWGKSNHTDKGQKSALATLCRLILKGVSADTGEAAPTPHLLKSHPTDMIGDQVPY